MNIIEDPRMLKKRFTRFPRSKSKRIRNKWAKNPRNFEFVPSTDVLLILGNTLVCHPATARFIREELACSHRDDALDAMSYAVHSMYPIDEQSSFIFPNTQKAERVFGTPNEYRMLPGFSLLPRKGQIWPTNIV